MDGLNDLLQRYLRDGDAAAMEQIVARTRGRLLSAARRIGSPQDAEDSVQATYHALLRRGERPLDAPLIAWLLTVTVRIAYRRKAINARQAQLADRLALPSDDAGPLRRAESTERGELLRAEVARLPAKYRDALVLRYFEGLTRAECAALLAVPEETVKTRLRRGRELLRGRLHPRVRHALWFVPWWLADTASAAPALGVIMKSKIAVVVAFLALLSLIAIGTNALRSSESDSIPRAARDSQPDSSKNARPPDPPQESSPQLRDTFDLDAADRDRDVHGIVVRENGSPVAGARLSLVQYPWRRANTMNVEEYHAALPGPTVLSARDGTFIMPWTRGRHGELRVEAEDLARRWVDDVQAGERVRIVMDVGGSVIVRVVTPGDAELPGAELVLRGSAGVDPEPWAQRATTDANGRARFENVAGNRRYWVEARHPDYAQPRWARINAPSGGETVREAIRMLRVRTVTGRVTDCESGAPIANARVAPSWTLRNGVSTDADGLYALPIAASDELVTLTVVATGYGREQSDPGTRDRYDFVLVRGDRVTGRVVDDAESPIADVRIAALGTVIRGPRVTSRGYATSGADGAFTIAGLRHDVVHTVVFLKDGLARTLRDIRPPAGAGGLVDIGDVVLLPGRSIEGRVLDATGEPMGRTPVSLSGANADRAAGGARAARRYGTHGEQEMRHTDDLGRFRFPDLAAGTYRVIAERPNSAPASVDVDLAADADRTDVVVRFDATRTLDLTVSDAVGAPVPDAFFSVQHEGGMQSARTDSDGRANVRVKGVVKLLQLNFINSLPEGVAYELPVTRRNIGADVAELRIELKRAGVVRGRVLLPDGKPVHMPLVQVRAGERDLRPALGNDDGTFRVEVPLDGPCDLIFMGYSESDGRSTNMNTPYEGKLEGVVAGARDVTIQLRPIAVGRTLIARVVDPSGKPLAKMRVFTQQHRRFFLTDAEGRVTLTEMLAKPTLVHAFPDAEHAPGLVPPAGVEIVPNGQEIEIRFVKGVSLRGVVVFPAGFKEKVFVLAYSGEHPVATANCEENGRFELFLDPAAGAGPFRIQVQVPARRRERRPKIEIDGVMLDGPEPRIELK